MVFADVLYDNYAFTPNADKYQKGRNDFGCMTNTSSGVTLDSHGFLGLGPSSRDGNIFYYWFKRGRKLR